MSRKVVILAGAGASKDCANASARVDPNWCPPLARELFNIQERAEFGKVLSLFPGARALAPDLADRALDSAFSLEKRLLEFSSSSDDRIRKSFEDVPRYLSALLKEVSERYVAIPGNYVRLVHNLVADTGHHVAIVTLNYDTLIEQAVVLFARSYTFDSLQEYIAHGRDIQIYKMHGSVNWFTRMNKHEIPDFRKLRTEYVIPPKPWPIEVRHSQSPAAADWLPVLTAPMAEKTSEHLVCPQAHVDSLRMFLSDCSKILFLGTSGLDWNVLSLLQDAMPTAESTHIVTCGDGAAVHERLRSVIPRLLPKTTELFDGGFRKYLNDDAFMRFLRI